MWMSRASRGLKILRYSAGRKEARPGRPGRPPSGPPGPGRRSPACSASTMSPATPRPGRPPARPARVGGHVHVGLVHPPQPVGMLHDAPGRGMGHDGLVGFLQQALDLRPQAFEAAGVLGIGKLVRLDLRRGLARPDVLLEVEPDPSGERLPVHRAPLVPPFAELSFGVVPELVRLGRPAVDRQAVRVEALPQALVREHDLLEGVLDALLPAAEAEVLLEPAVAEKVDAVVQAAEADRHPVRFLAAERRHDALARRKTHARPP